MMKHIIWAVGLMFLVGCGSMGGVSNTRPEPAPAEKSTGKDASVDKSASNKPRRGGYYLDDGPMDGPQPDFDSIPNAVPRDEPLLARANKPYAALGVNYTPMTTFQPYKARGIATWYGKRYHGQKTSTGEVYDMFGMTAAHTILPIPSYVRVTNPDNGRSVIVRVNDRGPFKDNRLIDLSYVAAYKLGLTGKGSGVVDVELIDPKHPTVATTTPLKTDKTATSGTFVQVGAFKQKDNADQLRDRILNSGLLQGSNVESWYNDGIHRVRLGPFSNRDEAERTVSQLKQSLGLNAVVTYQ